MPQGKGPADQALSVLSRRPACGAAILLIAGILLHPSLPDRPGTWIVLSLACAAAALVLLRCTVVPTLTICVAIVALGVAVGQLAHWHFPSRHIATYTADDSRLVEIEVELDQPPRTIEAAPGAPRWRKPRQVCQGDVRRIRTASGWRDACGTITLGISPPQPQLACGQRVRMYGRLSRPAPAANPGQFDWARYYRESRVLAVFRATSQNVKIVSASDPSALQRLRQAARDALARGFAERHPVDHALLRALVLGDSDPQLRDIQEDFVRTGTSHHLAISGMHVAVVGGLVFLMCRLLRLSPRKSAVVMLVVVLVYGTVALPSPPVVRSILLCAAFGIGVLCGRAIDGLQLLAVTVIAMLLYDPLDLYNAGFQLSFGTVLGLMLLATPLARAMRRDDEDARVLRSFGIEPSGAGKAWLWIKEALIASLAAGLVAWSVSAPLIIEHFDQLNPWAVPASLLLAIPVALSLIGGVLKIVLTLLMPFGAAWWGAMADVPVGWMRQSVGWLAKIPGSDLPLPALPKWIVAIYFVLLCLPLLPWGKRWLRWSAGGGAVTAAVAMLLLPALLGAGPSNGGELRVTLLSVGAGQCAVAELPGGKVVVFDAGSAGIADLRRVCIAPFLRHRGIRHIDTIFISHANADHFNAVDELVQAYGVREVVLSPQFRHETAKKPAARALLRQLRELGCGRSEMSAGQVRRLAGETTVEALWPAADSSFATANDSSLVLKLSCRGHSLLFTGDVQNAAQEALAGQGQRLRADVMLAPHHGSAEPATELFLTAAGAPVLLASDDRSPTAKQRLLEASAGQRRLLRTSRCGAITVIVDKQGVLKVSTFLEH